MLIKNMLLGSKARIVCFSFFLFGVVVAVFPILHHPEECPPSFTQQQIDSSGCIIGADIGSGLMLITGVGIALISLYAFVVTFLWAMVKKINNPLIRLVIFLAILLAPFGLFYIAL